MASIIAKNNSRILRNNSVQIPEADSCNCRNKNECPLPGKCQASGLIYQAIVSSNQGTQNYVGLSGNTFKSRYSGHKSTFTHRKKKNETTLSKHIWELKDNNIDYDIQWKILARAQPFSQSSGICQLCTREKFFICFKSELCNLNTRNELLGSCRHKRKLLISNQHKPKKKRRRNG